MTATTKRNSQRFELKLRDFCDRIGANYRDARYALAHGLIPQGIQNEPGRGNHRVFNYRQAFWLAILLKLKAAGIRPKLAAEILPWAERVRGLAANLGWDWQYSPFDGKFATENQWYLEVGDGQFVRILADANPSRDGVSNETGWVHMESKNLDKSAEPIVIIRIDLSNLSNRLRDASPQ